jgi:hypothetical protein
MYTYIIYIYIYTCIYQWAGVEIAHVESRQERISVFGGVCVEVA